MSNQSKITREVYANLYHEYRLYLRGLEAFSEGTSFYTRERQAFEGFKKMVVSTYGQKLLSLFAYSHTLASSPSKAFPQTIGSSFGGHKGMSKANCNLIFNVVYRKRESA